jgi:subtilisin family serine protease
MLILNREISILRTALLLTTAVLICTPAFAQNRIGNTAKAQIEQLQAIKASASAGEKKLSSSLMFASRQALGKSTGGLPESLIGPRQDGHTLIQVVIRGTARPELLSNIVTRGGHVDAVAPSNDRIEAKVPLDQLEGLATRSDVGSIRTPPRVRKNIGSLTSQAYVSHLVKPVVEHAPFVTGNGVKVGVLSDSASLAEVAFLQSTGDLGPGTTVLPGQSGEPGSDEGTAMMEIVQDLAPNAQLYFATAFISEASFASNIIALGTAGCTVIVDDVSYSDEDPFQDSTVAQAVNTFVAAGPSNIYFSSAANSGNATNGNSTTWEGDFVNGGDPFGFGPTHDFGGGQTNNQLLDGSDVVDTFWSDPLGGSSNDYDVYIFDNALTTVKGFSNSFQTGTQDPYEEVTVPAFGGNYMSPAAGDRVVVVRFAGATRALHIESFGESTWTFSTTGSAHGHNAAANTQSCAAVYWDSAHNGTKPFNGTDNPTEVFSSDGPRKIFFNPNGTAITPGNFLFGTGGGSTLQKPDISGADGVTTRTSGFNPFFGTSAAAPHAAGVAALIRQKNPALTNTQIANLLRATALDNMAGGWDRDGGFGVVNATAAIGAAGP